MGTTRANGADAQKQQRRQVRDRRRSGYTRNDEANVMAVVVGKVSCRKARKWPRSGQTLSKMVESLVAYASATAVVVVVAGPNQSPETTGVYLGCRPP